MTPSPCGLLEDIPGADGASAEAAKARIAWTDDLEAAAGAADLVIEAIPEKLELKRQVYARLGAAAPPRTIFVTNSSTLLPSAMAGSTGRPERFLALHFANEIWKHNVAEVMGHAGTDPAVYEQVVAFARAIGMVPIEIRKEKAGYVLNSLLVPFLSAASGLLVDGIADPQAIDRTWKIATGAPKGPFEIYDIVGLRYRLVYLLERRSESAGLRPLSEGKLYRQGKDGRRLWRGVLRLREITCRNGMPEQGPPAPASVFNRPSPRFRSSAGPSGRA
ncbi:3-hydroxyacyl-CoA dehydrogenase NAD-binding domain-containing protein [Brucella anthropi]|uniref:3-hydroxyacyl-CoA dehydrogenase NAD-binding domain-containing protein n=1 Tax=Brucella anthropi TaxID=529 RepID=UPI000DFC65E4|nr:3-hydroxyacyl-CoA dehydrogenase NAD-binding domain-containing protein [Brucella anthropi]SUB56171.1 Probable 3-hydroxybutyryl-CoA dehydrogenase [Brucella anthropi]